MNNRNALNWICEDCTLVFQTFGKTITGNKKRCYCPNCGDDIAVKRYKAVKQKKGKIKKRFWTDEELQVLDQVDQGKLMIYQAAIKLDRTPKSVRNRLNRYLEEKEGS